MLPHPAGLAAPASGTWSISPSPNFNGALTITYDIADTLDLSAVVAPGMLNLANVRLTSANDLNVDLQIFDGGEWKDALRLQNATSLEGNLNGNGGSDAVTQAQLDTALQNMIDYAAITN